MAIDEQLEILRQGPDVWNAWRRNHPNIRRPYFIGADLRGANLLGADLSEADLRGANLLGADLSEADLSIADLSIADLSGADLREADLRMAYLLGANLSGADLREADLRRANLRGADLSGADLRGANLLGADLSGAYLHEADLHGADFSGADLSGADLSGADLSGADLSGADLRRAYLRGANLLGADLSGADFHGAYLPVDNLRSANFFARGLFDVNFRMDASIWDDVKYFRSSDTYSRGGDGTLSIMTAAVHASSRTITDTAAPDAQQVDAAVFCPPQVAKGSIFLVQVFLYPPGAEHEAAAQAHEADEAAKHHGAYSLPLDLPLRTRVDIRLEMPSLVVAEPDAILIWWGRPTANRFEVTVPADVAGADVIGRIRFAVDGIPAGTLRFKLELKTASTVAAAAALCEAEAVRYRRAFVSYSSQDRVEVMKRVQAFKIAGLSVFQDVLDLKPGELWERGLYKEIDVCDVFLLFWSRAAAASEWVAKEIAYALARKAGSDDQPPTIQPVPIEGPPPPPPPETLRHLHFNDALLAHIQAASAR